jgi:putative FmdB family regulatory protein
MPTYEYKCKACTHELEMFQSMSDAPKRKCPKCGKNGLERKIGVGAAILFKGSGFYQTDYRSASYKKAAESDKSPESKSETKSEGKSESKADSTPAPAAAGKSAATSGEAKSKETRSGEARSGETKARKSSSKPKDAA